MKFYTLKSRITGYYLTNKGTYKSKEPWYLNTSQVNFWIEHFTQRKEIHKLNEMMLESYSLSEPRIEEASLNQRKTRIEQQAMMEKLKGY